MEDSFGGNGSYREDHSSTRQVFVIKRNKSRERFQADKIRASVQKHSFGLSDVDQQVLMAELDTKLYDGISTKEIDDLLINLAALKVAGEPQYGQLAARLLHTSILKEASLEGATSFSEGVRLCHAQGLLSDTVHDAVQANADRLNEEIDHGRTEFLTYFGLFTLYNRYFLRHPTTRKVLETPQGFFMRVAAGLFPEDVEAIVGYYKLFSSLRYLPSTPTLFNSGSQRSQLSSCFAAGTPVWTVNRGSVPIEKVQIGDLTITHTGKIAPVRQLHVNPIGDRNLWNFRVDGLPSPIKVTGNHRFWAAFYDKKKGIGPLGWKEADSLRPGDYIALASLDKGELTGNTFTIAPTAQDFGRFLFEGIEEGKQKVRAVWESVDHLNGTGDIITRTHPLPSVNPSWIFDLEGARFLGQWFGDGTILKGKKKRPTGISLVFSNKERALAERWAEVGERIFGLQAHFHCELKRNWGNISFHSSLLGEVFKSVFGCYSHERRIPREFFSLGREFMIEFLKGLIESDGCVTTARAIDITLTNLGLIEDLVTWGRSHGLPFTSTLDLFPTGSFRRTASLRVPSWALDMQDLGKVYPDNRIARLRDAKPSTKVKIAEDGRVLMRLSSKELLYGVDEVYNLGVDHEDHSYSVCGFSVANCFLLDSPQDSLESIFERLHEVAQLSKFAGGIGQAYHRIRSEGSLIRGTNGLSNGVVPWLKIQDSSVAAVNQCFASNTPVMTLRGFKPISELRAGEDHVLTARGDFAPIEEVFCYPLDQKTMPMVEIQTAYDGPVPLRLTKGHPLFVIRAEDVADPQPQWVDAGDVRPGDFLARTVSKEPFYTFQSSEHPEANAYLSGLLWGLPEGSYQFGTHRGVLQVPHTLGTRVRQVLGVSGRKVETWSGNDHGVSVQWSGPPLDVEVSPKDFQSMGPFRHLVLRGLVDALCSFQEIRANVDSEGLHSRMEDSLIFEEEDLSGDTLGKELDALAAELRQLKTILRIAPLTRLQADWASAALLRCGIPCRHLGDALEVPHTREFAERFRPVGVLSAQGVVLDPEKKHPLMIDRGDAEIEEAESFEPKDWLDYNGMVWVPVSSTKEIEPTSPDGFVYDLKVNGDESYQTATALAHNGGRRKGAACIYLATWHADIEAFLELRDSTGDEGRRTHNLNIANWIPDLFMRRVRAGANWSLFDPRTVPELCDLYGEAFEKAYERAEKAGLAVKNFPAQVLYARMMRTLAETGNGWMTYSDASNLKSAQTGEPGQVIHLSNLCTEVLEVTSDDQIANCNLGSLNLSAFVTPEGDFDFDALGQTVRLAVRQLDRVIDINFYPLDKARSSNLAWRPIGLGQMGLQDVFFKMGFAFDDPAATELSTHIAHEIYYYATLESALLAKKLGPCPNWTKTRTAKGKFQFDLWNQRPLDKARWDALRVVVEEFGQRNSLLIAIAPTATIASIAGCFEAIEPQVSNLFKREVLSGEFLQINQYLVASLKERGLWTEQVKLRLLEERGSVQNITEIPEDLRNLFRTAWEIRQRVLIDMAAARGPYIDQSQSLNLFVSGPTIGALSSMHMHAWEKGLKTTYYLRSRPATEIKQVLDRSSKREEPLQEKIIACSLANPESCEACQ